jgi:hypothetical protein
MVKAMLLSAALLTLGSGASAGEEPGLLHKFSCSVVRYYVAKYSVALAESWARSHGATDAQIERARHCLEKGAPPTSSQAVRLSGH